MTTKPELDVVLAVVDGEYLARINLAQQQLTEAAIRVTRSMRALTGAPRWIGHQWWEER